MKSCRTRSPHHRHLQFVNGRDHLPADDVPEHERFAPLPVGGLIRQPDPPAIPGGRTTSVVRPPDVATPLSVLRRQVIPVYAKDPKDREARDSDRESVDRISANAALHPQAGAVGADLSAGGDLTGIKPPQMVVLSGHGNVNSLNGFSGAEVATMLKNGWSLPKTYAGIIHINSCKAGDKGMVPFLATSLVEDVANALHGYPVTVEGMKGNVVTGPSYYAHPGEDRSVASDQEFEEYKRLEKAYRDVIALRDKEFLNSKGGTAMLAARSADLMIRTHEMELRQHDTGNSTASSFLSILTGASSKVDEIKRKILAEQEHIPENQEIARSYREEIDAKYALQLKTILDKIDDAGVPFGNEKVTVRHRPTYTTSAAAYDLATAWITFLQNEADKVG